MLEEKMMNLGDLHFQIDKFEIISNYENILKFVNYEDLKFFLSFGKLEDINLYLLDDCNFYLGISDDFESLFLPNVENIVDFQQCLLFDDPHSIDWLNEFFDLLK